MPKESDKIRGYDLHVFVCTNHKDNGESCAKKGSPELRSELKEWAKSAFGNRVRINASGCLGECARGICAVSYPKGRWWVDLSHNSLETLKAEITDLLSK